MFWSSFSPVATTISYYLLSGGIVLDKYSTYSYHDPITKTTIRTATTITVNPPLPMFVDTDGGGVVDSAGLLLASTTANLIDQQQQQQQQQCMAMDDGVNECMLDDVLRSLFFDSVEEQEDDDENETDDGAPPTRLIVFEEQKQEDPFGTCFPILENEDLVMSNFQSLDLLLLLRQQQISRGSDHDDEWETFLRQQLLLVVPPEEAEKEQEVLLLDHEEEEEPGDDNDDADDDDDDNDAEDVQITNNPVVQPNQQQRKRSSSSNQNKKRLFLKTRKVPRKTMLSNITSYDADFLDTNVLDNEIIFRELLEQVRLPTFYYEDYYTDHDGNEITVYDEDNTDADGDDAEDLGGGDRYNNNEEYTQQIVEPPTFPSPSSQPPSSLPASSSSQHHKQRQLWGINHQVLSEIPELESRSADAAAAANEHSSLRYAFVAFPRTSTSSPPSSSVSTSSNGRKITTTRPNVALMEFASTAEVADTDDNDYYYYYEYPQYDAMLDLVFLKRRSSRIDYDALAEEEDREPTYYTCPIEDVFTVYTFVEEELLDHEDVMWSVEDQLQPPFLSRSALSQLPQQALSFLDVPSPRCELSDLRFEPVDTVRDRRNGLIKDEESKKKTPAPSHLLIHALVNIDSPQCNLDELLTQPMDDVVENQNNKRRRLRQLQMEQPGPPSTTTAATSRLPSQHSIRKRFAELRRRQQQLWRQQRAATKSTTPDYGHHDFEDSAAFHDLLEQLHKIPYVVEQYEESNVETEALDTDVILQGDDNIDDNVEFYTALRKAVGEQNLDDLDEEDIEQFLLLQRRPRDDEQDAEEEDSRAASATKSSGDSSVAVDGAGGGEQGDATIAEAVVLMSEETEAIVDVEVEDNNVITAHHAEEEEEQEGLKGVSATAYEEVVEEDDDLEEEEEEEGLDAVAVESPPDDLVAIEEEEEEEEEIDQGVAELGADADAENDDDVDAVDIGQVQVDLVVDDVEQKPSYFSLDEEDIEEEEEERKPSYFSFDDEDVEEDEEEEIERKPSYFSFDEEDEEGVEMVAVEEEVERKPSYFSFDEEDEVERVEGDVDESSSDEDVSTEEEKVGSADYVKQLDGMMHSAFDESDDDTMASGIRRRREQQERQLPTLDSSDEEGDLLDLDLDEPKEEGVAELVSHDQPANIIATTDGTEIMDTEDAEDDTVTTVLTHQEEGEVPSTINVEVVAEILEEEKGVTSVAEDSEALLQAAGAATVDGFQIDFSTKMPSRTELHPLLFGIDKKILENKILREDGDALDDIDLQILREGCDWDVMSTSCVDNLDAPSVDDVEMLWHRWRDLNEDDEQLYQAEEQLLLESNVDINQQEETMEEVDH